MAQLKNISAFPEMFQIILATHKKISKPTSVESKNSSSDKMGGKDKRPNTE